MANHTRGKERPFPAPVIASLLFLACIFPGQYLIANLLPGLSGLATVNPGLVVFDIPIHLPLTIDLILVPALFLLVYALVLLVYPSGRGTTTWRETIPRLGAAFTGAFFFLFAAASGGFVAYLIEDRLPKNVRNGIDSLGIAADISLPFSAFKTIHLPGNIITLLGLIVGFAICIARISRKPDIIKAAPLTREQRMTPYERMQKEKRQSAPAPAKGSTSKPIPTRQPATNPIATKQPTTKPKPNPIPTTNKSSTRSPCQAQALLTLEPEAVAYMPMR